MGPASQLADLLADGGVVVLSGAGLSTESGIPDYRGPSGAARPHRPMTFQQFTGSAAARRRYWARSHLGWRQVGAARPNAGHRCVTGLQERGLLGGVVTQNVDGLHQAAGARGVVELHGSLHRVRCLGCGRGTSRAALDAALRTANPGWPATGSARPDGLRPDGDAEVAEPALDSFVVVDCADCGGPLKPDVVFFGETVPAGRVQHCLDLVTDARCLLVLGSSLTVMSGYRFVRRAARHGIPVAIVNQGPTRGDAQALLTVDAPLGRILPEVLDWLPAQPGRTDRQPPAPPLVPAPAG